MTQHWTPNAGLQELMDKAKREGLWFMTPYQELWFSPAEMQNAWNEGRFRWRAVNWHLHDPAEHLAQLMKDAKDAQAAVTQFAARIAKARGEQTPDAPK